MLAMCVPISTLVMAAGHVWNGTYCALVSQFIIKSTLLNFVRAKFTIYCSHFSTISL